MMIHIHAFLYWFLIGVIILQNCIVFAIARQRNRLQRRLTALENAKRSGTYLYTVTPIDKEGRPCAPPPPIQDCTDLRRGY